MRKLIVLIAAVVLMASAGRASAGVGSDDYDDSQSHPLRLLAYVIHPVGYTLEWLTMRPFHELVAQPDLEPVFGHQPHAYYGESPFGTSGWKAGGGVQAEQ
jgi:hypothetical protein